MSRKLSVVLLLGAVLVFSAGFAQADMPGDKYGGGKMSYDKLEMVFFKSIHLVLEKRAELNLSAEQVTQVKALAAEVKKSLIRRDADIETLDVEIKTLMWETPFDVSDVNKFVAQKYDLKKDKARYLVTSHDRLNKILTSKQVSMLADMK